MLQAEIIKLSELDDDAFKRHDAWQILPESYDDEEYSLSPADKNANGSISKRNREVWCLCKATFADGHLYTGYAMCRGDSDDGPILFSFSDGIKHVNLCLPPAPDFVLENDGPANLARQFNKELTQVFPIKFEVIPAFEVEPEIRAVMIGVDGASTLDSKDL